jgi:hypothetical protein
VAFKGDWVKTCEDFDPKFGDKRLAATSQQLNFTHFRSHPGNFWPETELLSFFSHLLFSVPPTVNKIQIPSFVHD